MNDQKPVTLVSRVLDYVIDNPGCSAPQIAVHFGISIQSSTQAVRRLAANGLIRRIPGPRKWGMQWEEGSDDAHEPKQSTVSAWERPAVKPQTWYSALSD